LTIAGHFPGRELRRLKLLNPVVVGIDDEDAASQSDGNAVRPGELAFTKTGSAPGRYGLTVASERSELVVDASAVGHDKVAIVAAVFNTFSQELARAGKNLDALVARVRSHDLTG
jgi:hypothetical protein